MKVLERKDWINEFSHVCVCPQCESKLQLDAGDLVHQPGGGDNRDSWLERFTVTCAVCGAPITIDVEYIPKYVQKLARDRSKSSGYCTDR